MKICAHMHLSPYQRWHKRFSSGTEAKKWLWDYLYRQGMKAPYDPEYPQRMIVYPQCNLCTDEMCFHDYPAYLLEVGPRGGIKRVRV